MESKLRMLPLLHVYVFLKKYYSGKIAKTTEIIIFTRNFQNSKSTSATKPLILQKYICTATEMVLRSYIYGLQVPSFTFRALIATMSLPVARFQLVLPSNPF